VQERIPVKLAVFNNGYLGMVRQWQQLFHGRRYSATPIWSPDFVRLAEAYGIAGWRVERGEQVEEAVRAALAAEGPALVEFVIEQEANVYPIVPPGASLSESIPDHRTAVALA
jgi:acetolactate synthase I/II/III large subunit